MCWLVLYVHILLYCHLQYGHTPLHYASGCGHLQTVRLLLQRGAEVNSLTVVRELHVHFCVFLVTKETWPSVAREVSEGCVCCIIYVSSSVTCVSIHNLQYLYHTGWTISIAHSS